MKPAWKSFSLFAVTTTALCVAPLAWAWQDTAKPVDAKPAEELTPAQKAAKELDDKLFAESAKGKSEIMKNLTHVCDVIGPRLTGSKNLEAANNWAAEVMKSYGLENVQLEPWEISAGWERGFASARLVEPDNGRSIHLAAAAWTPGTNGKLVCDVVIFNPKNEAEMNQYKGKLKNAIILRNPPSTVRPMSEVGTRPIGGGGPPPTAAAKTDAAAKSGDTPPKTGRSFDGNVLNRRPPQIEGMREFLINEGIACTFSDSAKPHGLITTNGSWRGLDRPDAPKPTPAATLSHDHYALLYRLASRPDAKTRVELEINNKMIPGPVKVYNTVGEIRGSEKPDEFVVIGAHIDSWDLAQGATDNGTGTTIVLEAARMIAKSGIKPKRTIRFALFSGEEQGLVGSGEYVKRHKDEMAKTSMCLVHDTGTGKVTGLGIMGRDSIKPILDRELTSLGRSEIGVTNFDPRGRMGATDHSSFDRAGVPGFYCIQDPLEYFLSHHTQSDTLDKAVEDNLIQGARVMAITAVRVANLEQMLPRDRAEQPAGRGRPGGGTTPPGKDTPPAKDASKKD